MRNKPATVTIAKKSFRYIFNHFPLSSSKRLTRLLVLLMKPLPQALPCSAMRKIYIHDFSFLSTGPAPPFEPTFPPQVQHGSRGNLQDSSPTPLTCPLSFSVGTSCSAHTCTSKVPCSVGFPDLANQYFLWLLEPALCLSFYVLHGKPYPRPHWSLTRRDSQLHFSNSAC